MAGLTAASTVALLLILGLILPGLPFDALFGGAGNRDIFETGAAQSQFNVEVTDVQIVTPEERMQPDQNAVAPPLPPNPVLGGVDIFYNCPDGCDDLVAQLSTIRNDFDAADSPIGLTAKTDMAAKILLVGADANQTLEALRRCRHPRLHRSQHQPNNHQLPGRGLGEGAKFVSLST